MLIRILAYLMVYTVWGSTYFFIKVSVTELPAFIVVGIRFLFGGILLFGYAGITGALEQKPRLNEIRNSILIGILLLIGGNGLVSLAVKHVDSYLAALIVATTPMAVLLYDRFLFGKKVSWSGWIGTIIGIIGVAFLLIKEGTTFPVLTLPAFLILIAVFLWALGVSLSKVLKLPENSIVNGAIQLFVVGIVTLFIANFVDPLSSIKWSNISLKVFASILYLIIFGSIALSSFAWLLYNEPNRRVVTYAFVNPLIAIFLGFFIGGEKAVPWMILGTALILTGLFLMFYVKPKTKEAKSLSD